MSEESFTEAGPAWLFCPADRPQRFGKAATCADVVILDLEDGVAPANRERAREALARTPLDPSRTVVRINAADTVDHARDLDALTGLGYHAVMLAKTESPAQALSLDPFRVVALCETPTGILQAASIAEAHNVDALMWGAEDLTVGLGGVSSRDTHGRLRAVAQHARFTVLLAARAAGKSAVDTVFTDIRDLGGAGSEAAEAAAAGFAATPCIHPDQVPVVRAAYEPSAQSVAWAERVLSRRSDKGGAFAVDGQMIDEPVLRQARAVLRRRAPSN